MIGKLPTNYSSLYSRWGPHTIDCFANYYNHMLPRFFSRFWNPNTAGVDFFIQPLNGENCLVVPLISIVPRVLHYMKCRNAVGTLVPFWPSAHYWPPTYREGGFETRQKSQFRCYDPIESQGISLL